MTAVLITPMRKAAVTAAGRSIQMKKAVVVEARAGVEAAVGALRLKLDIVTKKMTADPIIAVKVIEVVEVEVGAEAEVEAVRLNPPDTVMKKTEADPITAMKVIEVAEVEAEVGATHLNLLDTVMRKMTADLTIAMDKMGVVEAEVGAVRPSPDIAMKTMAVDHIIAMSKKAAGAAVIRVNPVTVTKRAGVHVITATKIVVDHLDPGVLKTMRQEVSIAIVKDRTVSMKMMHHRFTATGIVTETMIHHTIAVVALNMTITLQVSPPSQKTIKTQENMAPIINQMTTTTTNFYRNRINFQEKTHS